MRNLILGILYLCIAIVLEFATTPKPGFELFGKIFHIGLLLVGIMYIVDFIKEKRNESH